MSQRASFLVSVTEKDRLTFAELSGDYNPLHVDPLYASGTHLGKCVMHGAYSAGLLSRMAGMHLPGTKCLLHGMRLRFVKPIFTPAKLLVEGVVKRDDGVNGEVMVSVSDATNGQLLVEGFYQFGRHAIVDSKPEITAVMTRPNYGDGKILVSGASGGLGAATLAALAGRGIGLTRGTGAGLVRVEALEMLEQLPINEPLEGIVHCAWPRPNSDLLLSDRSIVEQVEHHIAKPLRECLALAKLLKANGKTGSTLILIGSSFSSPGRHAWRMPMYSLAKSMIPTLVKILSLELASSGHKVIGATFDMIDGGMNAELSGGQRQYHADRTPYGVLPTMDEAASQICWILKNTGVLASGGMIDLTGGAVP